MTPQEAIERCKDMQHRLTWDTFFNPTREQMEVYAISLSMAISALEATIPRVLTLEEALETQICVYIEGTAVGLFPYPALVDRPSVTKTDGSDKNKFVVFSKEDDWVEMTYDGRIRFWTLEPTPEQRADTPWKEASPHD